MKKILFLFFFPSIIYGQDILSDTIFVRKNNNIYLIVKQTIYTDGSVIESVDNYGDSLSTVKKITAMADNYSDNIAQIARGYINRNKINRFIKLQNDLHQQVTGKPVYFSTAIKDSIYYIGDWKLNFNGEIIVGVI